MRPRSLLVPLASLLLLLGCSPAEDGDAPADPGVLSLRVLPGIAQPGPQPATSPDAPLLVARAEPAQPGSAVLLQRETGQGWTTVARERQDRTGSATFTDPAWTDTTDRFRVRGAGEQPVTSDPVVPETWTTLFRDEFDGDELDPAAWSYRQLDSYNPDGSRQCSKSDESAVAVGGGVVELQVRRDPERLDDRCRTPEDGTHSYYLNGHISTDGAFELDGGVVAARVRFQRGRGQHGAFWLQREAVEQVPGDPGVSGAEIDVAEFFGEGYAKGGFASFIYYTNEDGEAEKVGGLWPEATRALPAGDAWWSRYHVVSVEWTDDEYVFRVDGRETFRTGEGVSGVPQFLVLSLLSSDWELGRLDPSTLPSSMQVDWVRAWRPGDAGAGVDATPGG